MRQRRRHTFLPGAVLRALLLVALVAAGIGSAQSAADDVSGVLPSTTVAAFFAAPTAAGWGAIGHAWDAVDLDAAMATLARLTGDAAGVSGSPDGVVGAPTFGFLLDELVDDVAHDCPELALVLRSEAIGGIYGPSVLAVSVSPFNPFPGALAVAQPGDPEVAAAFQDALVSCAGSDLTLQEGDVTLYVVGDGGDMPLVLARIDGLFIAATDPELARSALRLARGADEPRFVDGRIGREAAAMMGEGLGLALDLAALADALEGLRGMIPAGDEADVLVDRLLGSLRTVGGFAARVTIDADALRLDSVVTVDAAAGDVGLAGLLACEACRPGEPRLIPSGVLSLQARVVSPVVVVEWLDAWLGAIGDLIGERVDLRSLALEFAHVDLDRALLDWLGTTWHSAQVAPLGTDIRGWVTGPGTIIVVPVTSESAARQGLEDWRATFEALGPLLGDGFGLGPLGALLGASADMGGSGMLSLREVEYRGVPYERWRVGPTIDLAVAVLDGHLVLATPAAAMRSAIDVHHGAPGVREDPLVQGALAGVPADANAYTVFDVPRAIDALAALTDFIAAPAASALALAIADAEVRPLDDWSWDDEWEMADDESWNMEDDGLTGLNRSAGRFGADPRDSSSSPAATLAVPGSVTAEITADDSLTDGSLGLVFDLMGLRAGDRVQIEMLDPDPHTIDTYLYLFDLDAGRIVADNDDAPWTDRSEIVFEVDGGTSYAVIASSWGGSSTGTIVLNTSVLAEAAAADAEGAAPYEPEPETEPEMEPEAELFEDEFPPFDDGPRVTFDEVVALFDTLTSFLEELAQRSGVAVGSTEVVDGVSRSSLRIPLR